VRTVLLVALAASAVPPPLGWREPAPLSRMFLQLPFEAPEVLAAGELELGLSLLYSNSLLVAHGDALALDVDVEAAQPTVHARYGLLPGVEAQLAIPFLLHYGGFLDRPIEIVEGWVGLPNLQRRGRPRGTAHFQLTRPDGSGISEGAEAGLGDAWVGLKMSLAEGVGGGGSLALRVALKLPTGGVPLGSGELDLAAGILAGWCWSSTALRLQLDVMAPTGRLGAAGLQTRPYGAMHLGATQVLGDRWALHAQVSGHLSPLAPTGLGQIDGTVFYVLVGATVALSPSLSLEAAAAENIFSPARGADITFLFGLRQRL